MTGILVIMAILGIVTFGSLGTVAYFVYKHSKLREEQFRSLRGEVAYLSEQVSRLR